MNYSYLHLKIDQLVGYLNDDKINLIPSFQRGHVWKLKTRKGLVTNIVNGKPIPAIFLYRQAMGDSYTYNILDGKQRLESLILFIGNKRSSLAIDGFQKFFFDESVREAAEFSINLDGKNVTLADLDEELFRDFKEYVIPTIELKLDDDSETSLAEMIDLFVDINSSGEKVKRFDIVKAMSKDKLLLSAFKLIAIQQKRGNDTHYKAKSNEFTRILKKLQIVESIDTPNSRVDRMWELLVELILFMRTKKHRAPVDILKSFMSRKQDNSPISPAEIAQLRRVFRFLAKAYGNSEIAGSRLAVNQIHFYTMATSLIADNLLDSFDDATLIKKLSSLGAMIDDQKKPPTPMAKPFAKYKDLSAKHTTHPGRRGDRQNEFNKLINGL